jgi:DNA replication and repair protein RecF
VCPLPPVRFVLIRQITIENLRNLSAVAIEPHARLNYLYGDNGAGKTSVLEAITTLSRGRSFRTPQASELTGPDEPSFRVFAEIEDDKGQWHRAGLERSARHWRGRLDGAELRQLSQLTRILPTVVMEPDSHLLVSGAPEIRRRFLDWGVFHVEQGFLETWRSYARALKQRNSALRNQHVDLLDSLDDVLATHGTRLHELRSRYAEQVSSRLEQALDDLKSQLQSVSLRYQPGWNGESLLDALRERRHRDIERGQTGSGPHRADLAIACGTVSARTVLSRGEQKAVAAALLLIQAELLKSAGKRAVLLFDDLVSEFDRAHFEIVLAKALNFGSQVWMTGTECPGFSEPCKVFHVEQGRVKELV